MAQAASEEEMDPGDMNALEIQQQYFDNLLDCDFVKYQKDDYGFLLKNIAFALFGSPSSEGNVTDRGDINGYTKSQIETVKTVYKKILQFKTFALNNEDIIMSVLLIVCCRPKPIGVLKKEPKNYWVGLHKRKTSSIVCWSTAVFRVRTCLHLDGGKGCRMYVDENGRVYRTWNKYLNNNTLPRCVMVVPKNGEYVGELQKASDFISVKLTVRASPALGTKARILQAVDTTSTVATLGAMGVMGAAMFTPVAPVIMVGATIATVATGIYGMVRSSLQLKDRKAHGQTIKMSDGEARACYMNIAASGVGMVAGASTKLLAKVAQSGRNMTTAGKVLEKSVEVLRYSNMVASGGGIINSFAYMVIKYQKHGEKPTSLEVFQFASSTLFFANAVMSNRTAQSIIEEAQTSTIAKYRATLKGMQRKVFDKATAVARKIQGNVPGNTDIIRCIKFIDNKQQYFSDIIKAGKETKKLLLPIGTDSGIKLDAKLDIVGPSKCENGSMKTLTEVCTTGGAATGLFFHYVSPGELIKIGKMVYTLTTEGIDKLCELLEELSEKAHQKLMLLAMNLLGKLPKDVQRNIQKVCPDEGIIVTVVRFVFKYLKKLFRSNYTEGKDVDFIDLLEGFFVDGRVKKEKLKKLYEQLTEKYERKRAYHSTKKEIRCKTCGGIYYK